MSFANKQPRKSLEASCYQKLSQYAPLQHIGSGSFARVMLTKRKNLDYPFALKVLEKSAVVNERKARNIIRERTIMSKLDSHFVVKMHSAFQSSKQIFMVLDYCNGGDLELLLKNNEKLPVGPTAFYMAELANAVEYLHSQTVLFRDIKPENVLLDNEGHVKLSDFGLAVEGITEWSVGATTVCGTPLYMAPETFLEKKYGLGADWWSVGICAYEFIFGQPPYRGQKSHKIFKRITDEPLLLLRQWPKDVKEFLTKILTKRHWLRLGINGGAQEVLSHPFFNRVDLQAVKDRTLTPPMPPMPTLSKSELKKLGVSFSLPAIGDFPHLDPAQVSTRATATATLPPPPMVSKPTPDPVTTPSLAPSPTPPTKPKKENFFTRLAHTLRRPSHSSSSNTPKSPRSTAALAPFTPTAPAPGPAPASAPAPAAAVADACAGGANSNRSSASTAAYASDSTLRTSSSSGQSSSNEYEEVNHLNQPGPGLGLGLGRRTLSYSTGLSSFALTATPIVTRPEGKKWANLGVHVPDLELGVAMPTAAFPSSAAGADGDDSGGLRRSYVTSLNLLNMEELEGDGLSLRRNETVGSLCAHPALALGAGGAGVGVRQTAPAYAMGGSPPPLPRTASSIGSTQGTSFGLFVRQGGDRDGSAVSNSSHSRQNRSTSKISRWGDKNGGNDGKDGKTDCSSTFGFDLGGWELRTTPTSTSNQHQNQPDRDDSIVDVLLPTALNDCALDGGEDGCFDIPANQVVEIDDVEVWEHHDGFSMSPDQKVKRGQQSPADGAEDARLASTGTPLYEPLGTELPLPPTAATPDGYGSGRIGLALGRGRGGSAAPPPLSTAALPPLIKTGVYFRAFSFDRVSTILFDGAKNGHALNDTTIAPVALGGGNNGGDGGASGQGAKKRGLRKARTELNMRPMA